MNIGVVGSRGWPQEHRRFIRLAIQAVFNKGDKLISGGAKGVDSWGKEYAEELGYEFEVCYPDTDRYPTFGQAAYARNYDIASRSDILLAFRFKQSRGTNHTIKISRMLKKPTIVVDLDESGMTIVRV
jgi:hypothetical protein